MFSTFMKLSIFIAFLLVVPHAYAQTAMDASGAGAGSIIPGYDSRACDATTEGAIRYNSGSSCAEFCNGTSWTCPGAAGGGASAGYFVRTSGTYTGNLGGLSGADSACLTNLQGQSWKGKTSAGTLTSTRVKAWLCDGTTCNNLNADTSYIFAVAGNTNDGGVAFVTDSTGSGPGFDEGWITNGFMPSANSYWTNRASGTVERWGNTPNTNHCSNWSVADATQGQYGTSGNTTGVSRWNNGTQNCAAGFYLVCLVHPE